MSSRLRDSLAGVLVIDKPRGPTSARIVSAVKKRLDIPRVGHTGTLDPMATGVLPLCLGAATKVATFLLADDKAYEGHITLGVSTDTLDAEGNAIGGDPVAAQHVTEESVRASFATLSGPIEQIPPMYSALRQKGVRLHELARAGKTVERAARPVVISRFELTSFSPPLLGFEVECTKGTYVRSLARDVGESLGCGAHLSSLRRTRAGSFDLSHAVALETVDPDSVGSVLISAIDALSHLPRVEVDASLVKRIADGLQLRWEQLECPTAPPTDRFSLVSRELTGEFSLLAVAHLEDDKLAYDRVLKTRS